MPQINIETPKCVNMYCKETENGEWPLLVNRKLVGSN